MPEVLGRKRVWMACIFYLYGVRYLVLALIGVDRVNTSV